MQNLKISLIQSPLHWHQVEANLGMFEEKIWQIQDNPDLILLPEMFNTGFTMETTGLSEPMNSKTCRWMKQMAAQTGAVVAGSFIVKADQQFYNRLVWMQPDGESKHYDKRHLFRMANEHHHFAPGDKLLVCELKGWRICPLICYDLRFPVWSRNRRPGPNNDFQYDLLLFVANWPAGRVSAWDILLKARAVENLAYVAGLNRVGADGNEIKYNGHSAAYGPKGEEILLLDDQEAIKTIELDYRELQDYREKFPAQLDGDGFVIT